MARPQDALVMHHPEAGGQYRAIDRAQARVLEKSGWKMGELPTADRAAASTRDELVARADALGVEGAGSMTKAELAAAIGSKES